MTQVILEPYVQEQQSNQADTSLYIMYSETSNFLQPSDMFIDDPSKTPSIKNNIPCYINVNNSDKIEKTSLDIKLCKLTIIYYVSHNCVNDLLSILILEGHDLPRTARTLLKTPKVNNQNIISVHPGSCVYFGIEFMMSRS